MIYFLRQSIRILLLSSVAMTSAVQASDRLGFYCESANPWDTQILGLPTYIKTTSCDYVESTLFARNLISMAQDKCDLIAKEGKLPRLKANLVAEESCHNQSRKISLNLEEAHINKIASDNLYIQGQWLEIYVDNRKNEQPIIKSDGLEQAQWIHLQEGVFCGFPGAGYAFKVNESKSIEVKNLRTSESSHYEFKMTSANIDTYKKVSGPGAQFIEHSLAMGFLGLAFYDLNGNQKGPLTKIPLAVIDRPNQRVCVRTNR